jgi:cytidylate kinase
VSEGRDQGSVVFYNADAKFYLDASIETRAHRRMTQLAERGHRPDPDAVRDEIVSRDRRDASRAVGPLVCPEDAVRVDTDTMTQPEVVEHLARLVRERVSEEKLREAARFG